MAYHRLLPILWSASILSCAGAASKPGETAPQAVATTKIAGMPVTPASGPHAPAVNPFEGARFYINPEYAKKVDAAAGSMPQMSSQLKKVAENPTALWIDSIANVAHLQNWLDDAGKQEKAAGKPVVPVFVVYDLPNRDCSAKSSAGELTSENGGETRYRSEFIDKIAAQFKAHAPQRIVAIIEPDSLPNIATNLDVPQCAKSANLYKQSIAYAVAQLSLPNVYVYLDAAHAGWLGWNGNRIKVAEIYKDVLAAAGGADRIRGFATNVSNYNILKGDDGKKLEPSNPCPDELTYVQKLAETLAGEGITNKAFIIDTARNGKAGIRHKWGNWCNVKGAGLGERPRAAPVPLVDAYFWVKPPGESDGVSDPAAPRFDENCKSEDAASNAPQAGEWFAPYFVDLVKSANPPL
jgi:cellulose 1,4-beta-cellobiosidase